MKNILKLLIKYIDLFDWYGTYEAKKKFAKVLKLRDHLNWGRKGRYASP
jgi:predicted oxidoreductase